MTEDFTRDERLALNLEEARNLLFSDLRAATPRQFRGLPDDADDARRNRFAETILVKNWKVEGYGNPALGKTVDEVTKLQSDLEAARGRIGELVDEWLKGQSMQSGD